MSKEHIKRSSKSLNIRKIQVKTIRRHHFTTDWLSSKNLQTVNVGESVEERETSYTVGGNVNLYHYCGEQYGGLLKKHRRATIYMIQQSQPWEYIQRKL